MSVGKWRLARSQRGPSPRWHCPVAGYDLYAGLDGTWRVRLCNGPSVGDGQASDQWAAMADAQECAAADAALAVAEVAQVVVPHPEAI